MAKELITGSDRVRELYALGKAQLEAGRPTEASKALSRAVSLAPQEPQIRYLLALAYSDAGDALQALAELDVVLGHQPENFRAHNNRGSALQTLGRLSEAEESYRRALELAPHMEPPYINLGHLLQSRGKPEEARRLYTEAIAKGMDVGVFGQYLAALSGIATDRAPDQWVRSTFDNFAPTFDMRVDVLGYKVPNMLAEAVGLHANSPMDILDLGCGTGKCGVAFMSHRRRLIGVDLSDRMLAQARLRGLYDELHAAEISAWLVQAASASQDLVVAADVFIYIGALDVIFSNVSRILRRTGWFAFSIEECAETDYQLRESGRYAQSHAYIARLALPSYSIVSADPVVIRMEAGAPLRGRLYLLQTL